MRDLFKGRPERLNQLVRQVSHDGLRLREAAKLGFSSGWGPKGMKPVGGISVTGFERLGELVDLMLGRD